MSRQLCSEPAFGDGGAGLAEADESDAVFLQGFPPLSRAGKALIRDLEHSPAKLDQMTGTILPQG